MKFVIFAALVAVATAAPAQIGYQTPAPTYSAPASSFRQETIIEHVPILRDDRLHDEDGSYSFDVETGNGIVISQVGSPSGPNGAVVKSGEYSYTAPDGTPVHVTFVADENGYQPQSDLLPVAPEFPHPIPQFVLDQIAKAAEEDAAAARAGSASVRAAASGPAPSFYYSSPQ